MAAMVDRVALLARSEGRLREFGSEIPGSLAIPCDLTDPEALDDAIARGRAELGEPAMVERGHGAIIVTGNTSAWRGKADFSGFAPPKAAQRILAEAIAETVFHLAHQDRSAWSFNVEPRPLAEPW